MSRTVPLPLSAKWESLWAPAAEKYGIIGEAHLLLEILDVPDDMVGALLLASGVSSDETRLYAQSYLDQSPPSAEQKVEFSRGVSRILHVASEEAKRDGSPFIEPHHFLIACVLPRRGPHLGQVLRPLGLDAAQLRRHLRRIRANARQYPRGNPLNDLSADAKAVIEAAHAEMRASYCGRIGAAHLLLALLSDAEIADTLQNVGCDLEDLRKRARASIRSDGEIATPQKRFSPGAKRAFERAAREAKMAGNKSIGRGQLLLGLLPSHETIGEKWRARGRMLDSVNDLWTAASVAALGGALRGESTVPQEKAAPNSAAIGQRNWALFWFCFALGLMWFRVFSVLDWGRGSWLHFAVTMTGVTTPLWSAYGAYLGRFSKLSPRVISGCRDVFSGWIIALALAAVLLVHL